MSQPTKPSPNDDLPPLLEDIIVDEVLRQSVLTQFPPSNENVNVNVNEVPFVPFPPLSAPPFPYYSSMPSNRSHTVPPPPPLIRNSPHNNPPDDTFMHPSPAFNNNLTEEKKLKTVEDLIGNTRQIMDNKFTRMVLNCIRPQDIESNLLVPLSRIDALKYTKQVLDGLCTDQNQTITNWSTFLEIVEDILLFCFMNVHNKFHRDIVMMDLVNKTALQFMQRFHLGHDTHLPPQISSKLKDCYDRVVARSDRLMSLVIPATNPSSDLQSILNILNGNMSM